MELWKTKKFGCIESVCQIIVTCPVIFICLEYFISQIKVTVLTPLFVVPYKAFLFNNCQWLVTNKNFLPKEQKTKEKKTSLQVTCESSYRT